MTNPAEPSKKGLYATIIGTVLAAVCCATPLLVITLGAIGLGALTYYLDYILLPALVLLVIAVCMSYNKYKRKCEACGIKPKIFDKSIL